MLSDDEVQAFVKAQLRGGPLPRTPGEQEVQQILRALAVLQCGSAMVRQWQYGRKFMEPGGSSPALF